MPWVCDLPALAYGEKVVPARGGLHGVDGDFHVAVSAVFEADGRRKAAGQLAVHLAFGGARANGAPADEIANVLRRNHVQKLAGGGHAQAVDVQQQLARNAQALVDAAALVQIRVVDQPFPADGGARLFKVHAHHDFQRASVALAQRLEAAGVVQRGGGVVNGAGADDHEQPVIRAPHDAARALARGGHQGFGVRAVDGEKADQVFGRGQHGNVLDAFVVSRAGFLVGQTPGRGIAGHRGSPCKT